MQRCHLMKSFPIGRTKGQGSGKLIILLFDTANTIIVCSLGLKRVPLAAAKQLDHGLCDQESTVNRFPTLLATKLVCQQLIFRTTKGAD